MEKQTLNQQYDALISAFILHFEKKHDLKLISINKAIGYRFKAKDRQIYYISLQDLISDNLPLVKKEYFLEWYKLEQFITYNDFLKIKLENNS
jgi:hypothetical protein